MSSFGNELCIPISGWSGWVSKRSCKSWRSCHSDWRYFPCSSLLSPAPSSLWLESHCNGRAEGPNTKSPRLSLSLALSSYQQILWFSEKEPLKSHCPFLSCVHLNSHGPKAAKHSRNRPRLTFTHMHAPGTIFCWGISLFIHVITLVWQLLVCVDDSWWMDDDLENTVRVITGWQYSLSKIKMRGHFICHLHSTME